MKKKWIKWIIGLVCISNLVVLGATKNREVTLVLMPREKILQKVGLDLSERYPLLFITYKVKPNGAISLHGWTGSGWVDIKPKNYVAGSFFKNGPASTLIIEKENVPAPSLLIPPKTWCKKVVKIKTTQLRPLLHLIGRYFNFSYKYWSYFSQRATIALSDINPENYNIPWYKKKLKKQQQPSSFSLKQDLQYWEIIRKPLPPKPKIVPKKTEPVAKKPVKKQEIKSKTKKQMSPKTEKKVQKEETQKKPKIDPFKKPLPPAEVFGAKNVQEIKDKKEE